ncbi:MAG: DNA mismatch repair protein MutS [Lachnospiraceae bacterium]|nr:DNA mismatch repair protein MutS [Candidatus Colinaster equi]
MMKLYMETKSEYKDCILFYRLGDFYEMFFDDALIASKELDITLTGKQCGLVERAPMCGVPFHAVTGYLDKLVQKGYKVAICEQVEDPKMAKGLVKREVVRVVTPGTNISESAISRENNNYLMCILYTCDNIGMSVCDVSTGDYFLTELNSNKALLDEINKFMPSEIICNDAFLVCGIDIDDLRNRLSVSISSLEPHFYDEDRAKNTIAGHFKTNGIEGLGISDFPNGTIAAGALLKYLLETQKNDLSHISHLYPYIASTYMLIDSSTRRNLELTETMREKQKRGSLLWVLDKTRTAMGSRTLNRFIRQPLINKDEIMLRHEAVETLCNNPVERDELREYLNTVYDLERLMGKISFKTANARDMIALKSSMSMLPAIKMITHELNGQILQNISDSIDGLEEIYTLIDEAIEEEPPITIREGNIIKNGFNENIDNLRSAKTEGKKWLMQFESDEQERTGIKNLKVKYNKVFGYCIEISNSNKDKAPEDYIRKQTLTNAERFTTSRLKELEDTILNAEDKLITLEYDIFCEIRDYILEQIERIQKTAKAVAELDVFASLSIVAEQNHYVRPSLNDKGVINIVEGRHPVVEKMIDNDMFIANDTVLDKNKNLINVITGPNMAGKSTYMRQVALIVLMAQIGSFVPAKKANIGIVDRIFTRVGASDDLASGQSTFMVEMNEVANILRNATSDSLVILDEIGRGTSTFDGLSIAWAVIEHIANTKLLGAKTLFATHYHELTELEDKMNNVNNYCIAVKEKGDDIVFLRKIIRGGADKSYGIQVAKLAGIPDIVIGRAKELVNQLIDNDITTKVQAIAVNTGSNNSKKAEHYDQVDLQQMSLFETTTDEDVLKQLKELDISNLTPLDALNTLYKLQNTLNNRWSI